MIKRRKSKEITIGGVKVGGDAPISVQSMTKTDTRDVATTAAQIKELETYGCQIIRCGVPDRAAAEALGEIKKRIAIPLVADIHFDYRLALISLESGVDGLRLNPGNIGQPQKVKVIAREAKARGVPIRIGVNAGSLPADLDPTLPLPQRMVEAAMRQVKLLESLNFDLIKISLKAFDVPATIEAYREIARKVPYPLHLGITEAGTPRSGVIRSAVGIGTLLHQGIGDTIRVSLTSHPRDEVIAAYEILKSLDLRRRGPTLVSCPSCSRAELDIIGLASKVEQALARIDKPIRVAVMGCVVNGPGEASEADVGIACGKSKAILFRKGEKISTLKESEYFAAIMREVEEY